MVINFREHEFFLVLSLQILSPAQSTFSSASSSQSDNHDAFPKFQSVHFIMSPKTLKKSELPRYAKPPRVIKRKLLQPANSMSLNQSVHFTMSPEALKLSQLPPYLSSPKILKKAKLPPGAISSNFNPIKIMLFSNSGFYEPPKRVKILSKKRKKTPDNEDEFQEEENFQSPIRRTRSQKPDLHALLPAPTRYRRPKVYPSLTPWLDDWNVAELNDLYPKGKFKWDNSDVPDFDLGEPLDDTNFWERPWITANEERKKNREERERKRKKQLHYGGLKATGRKRAFKKGSRVTMKRENGKFVKQIRGKQSVKPVQNWIRID
jgi:hypothetical protein